VTRSSQNQTPAAVLVCLFCLIVLSLLFAADWSLPGSVDPELQTSPAQADSAPTVTAEAGTAEVVASEAAGAETVTTKTVTTETAPPPSISELGPEEVAEALNVAGFPNIEVFIDAGQVTLRGNVPDAVSQRAVLAQVAQVPGVEVLIDELIVG